MMNGKHTLNRNIERTKKPKDNVCSIKQLFKEPKVKLKTKFTLKDVAKHAAVKGQGRNLRNQNSEYRIAKLFRENKNNYKIEKLREYNYSKFNTTRSEYKIYGDIDLFQMHKVMGELIEKMAVGLPENVKLQITLENNRNDRVNQTKLLSKAEMILKLTDWVILLSLIHI